MQRQRREPCAIQGDSGGKVNIFGGESLGHCEKMFKQTCV